MEKDEKFQRPISRVSPAQQQVVCGATLLRGRKKIGEPEYVNENCWLAKTLNYSPAERCQYCELKFRNCLFVHYIIISSILSLFLLATCFLTEGRISKSAIIAIFVIVVIYGYFFNKSTEKIIKANFAQRKAKEALEELAEALENQVKERTKELRKAYEELKILDKSKTEFISIASHQLRTPLTAIKGYISMILEGAYGKLPNKARVPLENIYKSNERLIKLVNDLLNVSRLETGKLEIKPEKTSLGEIINGVIDDLKIVAEERGLYLKFEKPEKPLPEILIDKDKIRQAILNIIENAVRYTVNGGVSIKLETQNSKSKIMISDTGEGMTDEEISHIFSGFFRGTAGTQFWPEGLGIGLFIAKKFIEMHNGRVWAESEGKGKGSAFCIELPMK